MVYTNGVYIMQLTCLAGCGQHLGLFNLALCAVDQLDCSRAWSAWTLTASTSFPSRSSLASSASPSSNAGLDERRAMGSGLILDLRAMQEGHGRVCKDSPAPFTVSCS